MCELTSGSVVETHGYTYSGMLLNRDIIIFLLSNVVLKLTVPLPPTPMRLIFSSLIIHRVHQLADGRRLLVFGIINTNNVTNNSSNQQSI